MERRKNKRWTITDIEYIKSLWPTTPRRVIAANLGVSEQKVLAAMIRYDVGLKPGRKKHRPFQRKQTV